MNNYSHSEQTLPSDIIYMVLNNGKKIAAKEDAVLTFIEDNYDYSDDLDHVEVYEWCKSKLDAEFQEVMTRYYNEVVCKSSEFVSANTETQTRKALLCRYGMNTEFFRFLKMVKNFGQNAKIY